MIKNMLNSDSLSSAQPQLDDEPIVGENERLSAYAGVHPLNLDVDTQETRNQTHPMSKKIKPFVLVLLIGALAAGSLTGFGVHKLQNKTQGSTDSTSTNIISQVPTSAVKNGEVFGIPDTKTFVNDAQGYLKLGGLEGEGTHHLLRAGGPSQTVYLTSSITDLDQFEGMEIKVWGETFKAQKAGWLMDVGRVEVVNIKASAPTEE